MIPIDFQGTNITLTKPGNMTDEQCTPLKAMHGINDNGFPFFITAWMPNREDLDAINSGKPIYMQTISAGFPQSSLYTINDKGEVNE